MKTTLEQKPTITQVEITETTWKSWEMEYIQQRPDQEYWLSAEFRAEQHEIAKAAWELWEKEGCQNGRAQEYLVRAKQQLEAKQQAKAETPHAAEKRRSSPARVQHSVRA